MWCEKEPKQLKIATMYNFLPLVRTKASELSDFPVNTTAVCYSLKHLKVYLFYLYFKHTKLQLHYKCAITNIFKHGMQVLTENTLKYILVYH